jgi:tripartite-type tricarboxylate transporter receptor subunit TctC
MKTRHMPRASAPLSQSLRLSRRHWLALAATAAAATAAPLAAQTLTGNWRLVAPFPPGGPVDSLARLLATGLQERHGGQAVVDNRPGANGNLGIEAVKRAAPDGRTLLVIPAGNLTINPTLLPNLPYNVQADFAPVAMLAKAPNLLVAHPGLNVRAARELVALAKSRPGTLSFASPGVGSGLHLAGELFQIQTGTEMLHVPYKGTSQALTDVVGGTVPLMFSNLPGVLAQIRSGKLVAIGLTDSARAPAAPDIPTLAEQGIAGVVVPSWYAVLAPSATPPAIVQQLAREFNTQLQVPATREALAAQGLTLWPMTPGELDAHIRAETATWAQIIRSRKIAAQ